MKYPSMQEVISYYGLIPHVEGGFYHRTYRSEIHIPKSSLPECFKNDRSLSSTILYLVPLSIKSKLHKLKSDEIWHFYMGNSFTLTELDENGVLKEIKMGNHALSGFKVQHVVRHGCWFGGYVNGDGPFSFSLLGCTISPGFDERDFELAEKNDILRKFPQHQDILMSFF